ncbi:hypothetical protein [Microvirga sp. Mcv34]|uniref:hypothetical protein n=1 Tax=Microvirga sp. Mcv34 TaxID=2926016 RepID=UPI0021C5FD6D|nr:hypothetical protein [Microvirga sp. Mcv34]
MNNVMDRLYLELANVVSPETKTARELALEAENERLRKALEAADRALSLHGITTITEPRPQIYDALKGEKT